MGVENKTYWDPKSNCFVILEKCGNHTWKKEKYGLVHVGSETCGSIINESDIEFLCSGAVGANALMESENDPARIKGLVYKRK